jgi:pimeloyl-ACP methyl ester carboxylesterase
MWTALIIAMSTIAILALLVWAAFIAGRWFFIANAPDEIHFAKTDDGWRLAITRYRGTGTPVLLCPGIGANRFNVDLDDEHSLARAIAGAGHDTWILELRGRGLSTKPQLFTDFRYDWSFDEYVEKDAPAAIGAVLAATGKPQLHWVGFSLGANIGYGVLAGPLGAKIASAVCVGGPVDFKFQSKYLFSWPLRNLRWLKHRFLMRLLAPLAGYWRPRLLHNPDNISGEVIRRFMVNGVCNFAENEMLQYGDWLANDQFRSIDHRRDYRKDMAKIGQPILFVAGNQDRIAPPQSVKDGFEAVTSPEKRFVIASSRKEGFESNYGHYDLVLGENAAKDIFPLVTSWLAEREKV